MTRAISRVVLACLGASFIACASGQVPAKAFADSEASARAAETANAQNVPRAALHLQLAREHIAKAQVYMKENENDLAARSLRRAKADADLALALAESDRATREADDAQKKVQNVKQMGNN